MNFAAVDELEAVEQAVHFDALEIEVELAVRDAVDELEVQVVERAVHIDVTQSGVESAVEVAVGELEVQDEHIQSEAAVDLVSPL